jgi:hypothetical protein
MADLKPRLEEKGRSLYTDKWNNPSRRYCMVTYPQNEGTPNFIKQVLLDIKSTERCPPKQWVNLTHNSHQQINDTGKKKKNQQGNFRIK